MGGGGLRYSGLIDAQYMSLLFTLFVDERVSFFDGNFRAN